MNRIKIALVLIMAVFVLLVVAGVTPTMASSPSSAPPTVVLPTPVATKPGATSPRPAGPAAAPTRAAPVPVSTATKVAARAPANANFSFTYSAGFQVQNLSGTDASITINYYNQDGTQPTGGSVSDTVAANGSKTYFPIGPSAGFNGSVVISSDQTVASIVNILGTGGLGAAAAYDGSSGGNTSVALPLLMKNNYGANTWFNVQNAGSAAANVSISYSDGTTNSATSLAVGASATFNQASEAHPGTVFAGILSSSQNLVVTVIEEDSATMFAYSGFPAAGVAANTSPVMPLVVQNWYGAVTGIQIQNTSGAATTVTVGYTPSSAGTACTETQSIAANSSATFALVFWASPPAGTTTTCTKTPFVGSASVTSNSGSAPLQAIVNQVTPGMNGEAYGAFDPTAATNKVSFPLIMDRNYGSFTGFNVMNVNTSGSTTVTCTFSGSSYTVSGTLAPGQALTDVQVNKIAPNYAGSATCTGTNTTDHVVGVVNELGSGSGDQLLVYEGISY